MVSRQREWQRKKIAQGLCPTCGKETLPGRVRCKKHLAIQSKQATESKKRKNHERILAGKCIRCGLEKPNEDDLMCKSCRESWRLYMRVYRKKKGKLGKS